MSRPGPAAVPTRERILQKVFVAPDGCWIWTGSLNAYGYGQLCVVESPGKYRRCGAHRLTYEIWRGEIPDGLVLDHIVCDQRLCCNPWHVEPTTNVANVMRGNSPHARNARKTHCNHGHPFDETNTYHHKGQRACRSCQRSRLALAAVRNRKPTEPEETT